MADQQKGILLPNRTTRGNRYRKLVQDDDIDDEQQEDKEFWQQEFFKDEERDDEYLTESEPSDIFESDFLDTEDDEEETGPADEDDGRPRKKRIKPPGYKQRAAALKRKRAAREKAQAGTPSEDKKLPITPKAPLTHSQQQLEANYEAPSLRRSTREKVEEAKEERKKREKATPKRKVVTRPQVKQLTQEQLLAEAAATEIDNTRSLQLMEAVEEETKRRAAVDRVRYEGPRVQYLSRAVDGKLVTTLQTINCDPIQTSELYEFKTHTAPPEPRPATCFITGRPAAYRDPTSGLPYSDGASLLELRHRVAANVPMQSRAVHHVY